MAAIITKDTRLHNARQFVEAVGESANTSIYMFLGKPGNWPTEGQPPTPLDTYRAQADVWDNMEAMKRVTTGDITHVIPRTLWTVGTRYARYDDSIPSSNLFDSNFVVINSQYNVYKCLSNGESNVTINEPTGTGRTHDNLVINNGAGQDSYVWKYMYNINTANWTKFGTSTYMPVVADSTVTTNAANARGIYAYRVLSANIGAGYASTLTDGQYTLRVQGDGTQTANANIKVVNGNIANIFITSFNSYGNGFTVANVTATTSGISLGNAIIEPICAPPDGHGYDAVDELGGVYAMVNVRFEQTDNIPVSGFKFRQVGLLKDPYLYGTTKIPTETGNSILRAYSNLTLQGTISATVNAGDTITGATSGANATVVSTATVGGVGVVNFVQARDSSPNVAANYYSFAQNETIKIGSTTIGTTKNATDFKGNATVSLKSGEIIYVDNRNVITRASDQVEDIYIVLEF